MSEQTVRVYNRRWLWRRIVIGLCTLVAPGALAVAKPAARPALTGSLQTVEGVRVLKVWGGPYERGYAHGFLLGDEILSLVRTLLTQPRLVPDAKTYEDRIVNGLAARLRFAAEQQAELEGILAGMKEGLGEQDLWIEALERSFQVADLRALNAFADWYRLACSSFSAWGPATESGEMITARNLDFMALPGVIEKQILLAVLEPGQGRKRWVSVTWPGMIGAYTAMNEEGVTVSIHDAPGLTAQPAGAFVPRSLALREVIERASAASAIDDALDILRASPVMVGNIVHVSAPFDGQKVPAAIFEYDGDGRKDRGVTRRIAGEAVSLARTDVVYCTNHYRNRNEPESCNRFATIERMLSELANAGRNVDVDAARRIMHAVAVEGTTHTVHTVVFLPNQRELFVGRATPKVHGAAVPAHRFRLRDLFNRN